MAISAPGVGSNLDVSSIVSQLMTIEQRPRLLLDAKEAAFQAQLSAYGQLRGALSALESAVGGLADRDRFEGRSASVGDSTIVSASAGAAAANATYEVAVTQLAQRQSLTTAAQTGLTAPVGSGATTTLTFEFGTISGGSLSAGIYTGASFALNGSAATRTVTLDASNNSLQGIRDAINAANVGVTASILNVGGTTPYRLVLQSAAGGSATSLRIGVSGDAALESLLAYDPAGTQNLTQTVAAQDANLTVNGVAITSGSNTLADAIQGVTLSLAKVGTTTVTIGRDPAAAQAATQGFVKAYNDLNTLLHNLTRFDAENEGSGALVGDSAARTIQSQLRNALSSALAGGNGNTLRVLSQVGMSFQKDGSLALDSGKLTQALASDPAGVARLFASGGAASDSLVKVVGSGSATVPGSYAVEITQLATRGQLVGSAAATLTITAAVNDVLAVTVDGTSATLTLPAGTYTASQLAAQVQSLVNASSSLSAANAQVTVSEAAGVFTLTSKRYGSGSTLSVDGSAAATLLGATPTATPGVDVAGSIGGFSATGSGQRLTAVAGSPTTGLVLDVTGGSTGTRGTVSFARGYAARLEGLLQGVLGTDGAIASRTTGINATIKDLDRQRDVLDRRLAQIEARYRKQFTALDGLMSRMTATSTFLTQQLQQLQRLQSFERVRPAPNESFFCRRAMLMNAVAGRAVDTYTRLEVETGVAAASPQKLVVMLYEGAIKAVLTAQAALARGDLAERGAAISKAISIIDEGLRSALDLEAGGEIAANLMALYEYVANRLLYANLKGDGQSLEEVAHLLTELKTAWEALERQSHPVHSPERTDASPAGPRPALSYGKA